MRDPLLVLIDSDGDLARLTTMYTPSAALWFLVR